MNYFEQLNGINVNDHVEQKNGLDYLNWAYAWQQLKKKCPTAEYTIYENADGWIYHTDGRTAWVKTGVTVTDENGVQVEHIEYLPVMDFRNRSIPVENITSFDVNKTIQRSLTKAIARHGLGISLYIGWKDDSIPEDLNLSDRECSVIKQLLEETDTDVKKFLKYFKANSVEEMKQSQYGKALQMLSKKKEGK